jgi:carbonic anhydrase/acetyltransferase-like protein (isoleucine patch superfamily)
MLYALEDKAPQLAGDNWVADNAAVIGDVRLGKGASVWFGCTVRGDNDPVTIGENTNIQDGTVLHTDVGVPLVIGANVTVGHQVMLHGCTIGENTLVGIQSVILNRARIGRNSIVGAGSLVPEGKSFPDGVLLMGSPAQVKRELTAQEIAFITLSAQHYVQNARRFATKLRPVG